MDLFVPYLIASSGGVSPVIIGSTFGSIFCCFGCCLGYSIYSSCTSEEVERKVTPEIITVNTLDGWHY